MAADVSTPSGEYTAMQPVWQLISDIRAGAAKVREVGTPYLPKYESETDPEYDRRRLTAPWRPEFTDALRTLAAKPFGKDVGLKGETDAKIKAVFEDVDGRGNSLTAFARETFTSAVAKGLHAILVDYPTTTRADGVTPPSVAEERATGARPYWVQVPADNILALYTEIEAGREVITHVRIRECAVERDGFEEITIERVRVLEPGRWELWEKRTADKAYGIVDGGTLTRGVAKGVPLVLFFTGEREGTLKVKPPLADLAQMQMELFQALSRQDEILTFAGAPMLCAKGLGRPPADAPVEVGPKRVLFAPPGPEGTQTSYEFIQPDAANIAEIRNHVTSITDDMRRLGMQPLTLRSGTPTATGQSIEAAKAHSACQAWAIGLKDALEQAFVFTAEWLGITPGVEVEVSTDFSAMPFAEAPLTALDNARSRKDISRETYWGGLKRFDVLPADFDPETEAGKLEVEAASAPTVPTPRPDPAPPALQ